jgi:hypothetical protein
MEHDHTPHHVTIGPAGQLVAVPIDDPAPARPWIMLVGEYADTEVLGVFYGGASDAADLADHMSLERLTAGFFSGDMVAVRAASTTLIDPHREF